MNNVPSDPHHGPVTGGCIVQIQNTRVVTSSDAEHAIASFMELIKYSESLTITLSFAPYKTAKN